MGLRGGERSGPRHTTTVYHIRTNCQVGNYKWFVRLAIAAETVGATKVSLAPSLGGEETQEINECVQEHGRNQRLPPGYERAEKERHDRYRHHKLPRQSKVHQPEQAGLEADCRSQATCPCVKLLLQVAAVEELLAKSGGQRERDEPELLGRTVREKTLNRTKVVHRGTKDRQNSYAEHHPDD